MLISIIQRSLTVPEEHNDPFADGRYRLLSRLSSSRTGELCLIEHRALGKHFLAKLLHPCLATDPQALDRLRLEAQVMGRLRHPNIVGIVGFEYTSRNVPYLVLDLVRGPSLEQELATCGIVPMAQALEWTRQLLDALEATHALGIVHREIQPRNLMLHCQPEGGRVVKLLNFDAARVFANPPDCAQRPLAFPIAEGTLFGTPCCASPEAIRGQGVDVRSDLYQAGLVLRWMLTGCDVSAEMPDSGVRAREICAGSSLPAALEFVLQRALADDPHEQFLSAAEFRDALPTTASAQRRAGGRGCSVAPRRPGARRPENLRRFFWRAALVIALFLVSSGATLTFGLLLSRWW